MAVNECPNVNLCPLYPQFGLETSLRTLQILYCEGDYTSCERYKRQQSGQEVPRSMLPNGKLLR